MMKPNPVKSNCIIVIYIHCKPQIPVTIKKKMELFIKQFHENVLYKTPIYRKLGHSSEMRNDALMHREEVNMS